jgi:hypothetical protein
MTKRLTVRIRPDGSIEAETHGMQGTECLPYIETIEGLTDARAVDSWYTAEFFETQQPNRATQQAKERNIEEHG